MTINIQNHYFISIFICFNNRNLKNLDPIHKVLHFVILKYNYNTFYFLNRLLINLIKLFSEWIWFNIWFNLLMNDIC